MKLRGYPVAHCRRFYGYNYVVSHLIWPNLPSPLNLCYYTASFGDYIAWFSILAVFCAYFPEVLWVKKEVQIFTDYF